MADIQARNEANRNAHRTIATTIANALDAIYLQPTIRESLGYRPLTQNQARPTRYLIPILPHALGFCPDNEDIHFTYVADVSFRTFWEHMLEAFDLDAEVVSNLTDCSYAVLLKDIAALRGLRLLGLSNVRLVLTYSPRPTTFSSLTDYQISKACVEDRSDLAKIFDQQSLSRMLHARLGELEHEPDRKAWSSLYRSGFLLLYQWALAVGLISPQLNMMNIDCLLLLYSNFFCSQPHSSRLDADGLLKRFLTLSFVNDLSSTEKSHNNMSVMSPSGRNLAARISLETMQAIKTTVSHAVTSSQFDLTATNGLTTFAATYKLFIKVNARCWDVNKRSEFNDTIPDTLLALQVHIRKSGKDSIAARIWPHGLTDANEETEGNLTYLLAAYSLLDNPTKLTPQILKNITSTFFDKLKFSREYSYITHEILDATQLSTQLPSLLHPSLPNPLEPSSPAAASPPKSASGGKFRTASAVMNRLRWDPQHSATEHEIGYEDRFEKELMWKSLKKWEQHTENEEFVPEHRIWKIRRKEDRRMVWDRGMRWDGTDD